LRAAGLVVRLIAFPFFAAFPDLEFTTACLREIAFAADLRVFDFATVRLRAFALVEALRNFPFAAVFLDFFIARLLPKLVAGV